MADSIPDFVRASDFVIGYFVIRHYYSTATFQSRAVQFGNGMIFGNQEMIVLIAVAVATVYLTVRGWRWLFRPNTEGCGGCQRCSSADTDETMLEIRGFVPSDQIVLTSTPSRPNRGARPHGQ